MTTLVKGNLLGATGTANQFGIVPVGADGQPLIYNSGAATGINGSYDIVINSAQAFDTNNLLIKTSDGSVQLESGSGTVDLLNIAGIGNAVFITTTGDVSGAGLKVSEAANGKMGRTVLVAGSNVVSNTSVTAASEIMLTTQIPGGVVGYVYVSARTVGVSFTITSLSVADTSTVAFLILEPA